MKVDLKIGTEMKDFVYPKEAIFSGLISNSICKGLRIANTLDCFNDFSVKEEKIILPDGKDITLLIYLSDDEELQKIMEKYNGLRILEVFTNDASIVATL